MQTKKNFKERLLHVRDNKSIANVQLMSSVVENIPFEKIKKETIDNQWRDWSNFKNWSNGW